MVVGVAVGVHVVAAFGPRLEAEVGDLVDAIVAGTANLEAAQKLVDWSITETANKLYNSESKVQKRSKSNPLLPFRHT